MDITLNHAIKISRS